MRMKEKSYESVIVGKGLKEKKLAFEIARILILVLAVIFIAIIAVALLFIRQRHYQCRERTI